MACWGNKKGQGAIFPRDPATQDRLGVHGRCVCGGRGVASRREGDSWGLGGGWHAAEVVDGVLEVPDVGGQAVGHGVVGHPSLAGPGRLGGGGLGGGGPGFVWVSVCGCAREDSDGGNGGMPESILFLTKVHWFC